MHAYCGLAVAAPGPHNMLDRVLRSSHGWHQCMSKQQQYQGSSVSWPDDICARAITANFYCCCCFWLTGNVLFSKGRYLPAAERYTEAITLIPKDPGFVTLYVNRAMCYKKVERWQAVVDDAATALSLDSSSMKAHYLLGIGLREQQQLSRGISHLQRALEAAREKGDSIKDEM